MLEANQTFAISVNNEEGTYDFDPRYFVLTAELVT